MAEDGLLGKKLTIALVDEDGNQVGTQSPEILKFSVKERTDEDTKAPIGEDEEYTTQHQKGFEGSLEGQEINSWYDDVMEKRIEYQKKNGGTLKFAIFTTKIYKDGTVQKYKYPNVVFSGFEQSADGNSKPITNKVSWKSGNRIKL